MSIYHLSVKPVQRSAGRSATAAAAYRAGAKIEDERTGLTHDYTRKTGVVHSGIVGFAGSRSELWNLAEAAERRKDATTAREYEVALPRELDEAQQIELAREYASYLHQRHGCAVDFSIHRPDPGEHGNDNPHAHILTTTRAVDQDGHALGEKCAREWSDAKRAAAGLAGRLADLEEARETWETMQNAALERAGIDARVDHRSNEARGLHPAPHVHVGPKATAMERRGVQSERGDLNREIDAINEQMLEQARRAVVEIQALRDLEERKRLWTAPEGFQELSKQLEQMQAQARERQRIEARLAEPLPDRRDLVNENIERATRTQADKLYDARRAASEAQGAYERAEREFGALSWTRRTFSLKERERLRRAAEAADRADKAVSKAENSYEAAKIDAQPRARRDADATLRAEQKERQELKLRASELPTQEQVDRNAERLRQHPEAQRQREEARESARRMAEAEQERQRRSRERERDHERDHGPRM